MEKNAKKLFGSVIFDGILLIVLGLVMIIWPNESLKTLCIIIGAVLGIMGLIKIIVFFTKASEFRTAGEIIVGIIELAFGIALIAASGFFITVFQYIIGVILAYGAITMFINASNTSGLSKGMSTMSIIFGVLTALLALIIFFKPAAFASFMVQLEGVALMIEGIASIIVLRQMKI